MAIENTVSSDFLLPFVDFQECFRLPTNRRVSVTSGTRQSWRVPIRINTPYNTGHRLEDLFHRKNLKLLEIVLFPLIKELIYRLLLLNCLMQQSEFISCPN